MILAFKNQLTPCLLYTSTIKRKITDLDRMKIEEQKKEIRSGYDMEIIPSDLATYGGEAKNLLRNMQSRNERMFLLTLLVLNVADTKQKLDNDVFQAASIEMCIRDRHFGIRVGRNGMCVCPFHADKNPSMKVDRRFHCFGCQADGDVIDFVSRLEAVSPKEAALILAQAFSIPYEDKEPPRHRKPRQETPEQRFRRMERYCFRVLCDYRNLLRRWKRDYAPKTPDEDFHPLFVEALQKQDYVDYLLDVLLSPDMRCV